MTNIIGSRLNQAAAFALAKGMARQVALPILTAYVKYARSYLTKAKNKKRGHRALEIGPGPKRIEGFETVNIVYGRDVDYIADATKSLPFPSGTFDIVFASHVLEHTPWFRLDQTIEEWVRVLKPGGQLEIWVPDGHKISALIVDLEAGLQRDEWRDDWRPFNSENDPFKWANGRLLYGVRSDYPSWHQAILTPKFLISLLSRAGLNHISLMEDTQTRGERHGWINLGVRGYKE